MIKLESFAMPSNSSLSSYNMLNRDLFNSRDMCISPALLDFLEQTLEPFDNLIKASFESSQPQNRLNLRLLEDARTAAQYWDLNQDENGETDDTIQYNGDDEEKVPRIIITSSPLRNI
jgi:hypothetical protein